MVDNTNHAASKVRFGNEPYIFPHTLFSKPNKAYTFIELINRANIKEFNGAFWDQKILYILPLP
jgi:hypothetical protein